jgi:lauroyl/myristoyl acyltransferase
MNRALDLLPWPWGEHIMATLGVAHGLAQPARRRGALRWAGAQGGALRHRIGLALALLEHYGRVVADGALVGMGEPEALRRHVRVEGEAHLTDGAGRAGTILLGFHLGLPSGWLALRLRGHGLTFVGALELDGRARRRTSRQWRSLLAPEHALSVSGGEPHRRLSGLYDAWKRLRAGGTVYITADGELGREAFRVPLPGGPALIREGWLALRRATGARTLPVLARREGRMRVLTIYPALPAPARDPVVDRAACARALAPILEDYVRRFPAQCWSLALWPRHGREAPERRAAFGEDLHAIAPSAAVREGI